MTPQSAFEYLNRAAGIAPLTVPHFEGREAVVPTPFRAATAAAAALGLAASAAAEIWRFRGGEKQTLGVDLAAAAAFLVSHRLARRNGETVEAPPPGPATGFYQSADGRWLYLSGPLPHQAKATLDLLNAKSDSRAVMDSVSKWNALALEDALAFLGLTGAIVRTEEEWRCGIAGNLVGAPIVLKKIGQAPPLRLANSVLPLAGVRVLDLTRAIAGPACGLLLAQHGAEVLSVGNDRLAALPEFDFPLSFGKRRTRLDLAKPAEAETLRRLARGGAVFLDSCRPGALASLGFSPASLALIAPGSVYVSISAYGAEGPWAPRRGWEEVTQAATGLAMEHGAFMARRRSRREALPELLPALVCDYLTGALAAAGALAALLRRIREGGSWLVQVSLAASAGWLQSLGRLDEKQVPERWEPRRGLDAYLGSCETKDGRFEVLGPVVRMSKTPPLVLSPPDRFESPNWASAHEEANAAEIQPAET